jgi:hypothetical protein
MHEAVLAQAALPTPARILGLRLRDYSLGHELFLIRENNPLAQKTTTDGHRLTQIGALKQAVLICSCSFEEARGMHRDPLMRVKLWLWNRAIRKWERMGSRRGMASEVVWGAELERFRNYQRSRDLELPVSNMPDADGGKPGRPYGAPFLLRVQQFLVMKLGLSDAEAWNYPYALGVLQWETWCETEGSLRLANHQDAVHQAFVDRMESEARERLEGPKGNSQAPTADSRAPIADSQAPIADSQPQAQIIEAPDRATRPAGYDGPLGAMVQAGQEVVWVWTADAAKGVRWVSGYVLKTAKAESGKQKSETPEGGQSGVASDLPPQSIAERQSPIAERQSPMKEGSCPA